MKIRRYLLVILEILYVLLLVMLLLGDNFFDRNGALNHVNMTPFFEIERYINAWETGSIKKIIIIENLLGNLLLFAPLVVIMMALYKQMRKWYVCLTFYAVVITGVELLQYYTSKGSCDIDDFILNFTGVCISFIAFKICEFVVKLRKKK